MVKRPVFGGVFVIAGLFVMFSNGFAFADNSASVDFSIDASDAVLQLSVPRTANISLNPVSSSGDFGFTTLEIIVGTNNETGYTLTMSPESSDENYPTSLISGNGFRIDTLAATDPASTGYTQESFTANRWGYCLSSSSNYYPMPAELAPDSWITDVNTNNTTHYLTFAAKVDGTQPADIYETTLNFEAVANPGIGKHNISFNGNGADGGTAMSNLVVYAGETENLPENTYTLTGYRFTGWSTSQSGSGMYYGNESSYSVPSDSFNTNVTLYAQWVPSSTPEVAPPGTTGVTIARAYEIAYSAIHKGMYEEQNDGQGDYALVNSWPPDSESYQGYDVRFAIQDMTTEICDSVTVLEDSYAALDIRDNNLYNIVKLRDGRCWMQEYLRLDPSDSTVKANLSPSNTNVDATTLSAYKTGNGRVSGDSSTDRYPVEGVKKWVWSQNKRVENIPLANIDYVDRVLYTDPDTGFEWTAGVYYNFCAASAGSYCYDYEKDVDIPGTDSDAEWDLCPYGWRLPTFNGTSGDLDILKTSYTASFSTVNNLIADLRFYGAGSYNGGTPNDVRYFISSTKANIVSGIMTVWFGGVDAWNAYEFQRVWGIPIRCVSK